MNTTHTRIHWIPRSVLTFGYFTVIVICVTVSYVAYITH